MDAHPSVDADRNANQGGSILVSLAGVLLLLVVLLGSIQMGYAFYIKRDLQKAADLAALSGVQMLVTGSEQECAAAKNHATQIAHLNFPGLGAIAEPICEVWSQGAEQAPKGESGYNAIRVNLSKDVMTLVPFSGSWSVRNVQAVAAVNPPLAAFSVESRLLRVDGDGLLGLLLRSVGLAPDQLNVLDSDGLITAQITTSGLLKEAFGLSDIELNAGTAQELASLPALSLGQLLGATATVLGNSGVANAGLMVGQVDTLKARLESVGLDVPIKLFGDGGIMAMGGTSDVAAALTALVSVKDLIAASVISANGENMLDLSVDGALFDVATAKVQIVAPPTIGIGGKGTEAYSAQIRVYLHAKTSNIPIVGPLLRTTGTFVDLPIILEVASSKGVLTKMCDGSLERDQVEIEVSSSLVNLCVGRFEGMSSSSSVEGFLSTTNSCFDAALNPNDPSLTRYRILNVLGILPISSKMALPLLSSSSPLPVRLTGPVSDESFKTVSAMDLNLSHLARSASDAILGGLLGDLVGSNDSFSAVGTEPKQLAQELVGLSGAGRSISTVVNELQWSKTAMGQLGDRLTSGGLTGFLGGTLQTVGNILNTILLAPLSDLTCSLAILGGESALRACRVNSVEFLALSGGNLVAGVAAIVIALLEPLLQAPSGLPSLSLGNLLQQILNPLGLNLGETDVALHSVQCGGPRLVE